MENEEIEEIEVEEEEERMNYDDYCFDQMRDMELEEEYLQTLEEIDLQNENDEL